MPAILVIYATGEGQTAKVAQRIESTLETHHQVTTYNIDDLPAEVTLSEYDGILVGASIHRGKQQKQIKGFVSDNRAELATVPSGFFQVSLSAAIDDEEHQAEALGYVDDMIEETGWQPDRLAVFGGALRYSQYGFLTRSLLKYIAKRATGDTDTSRDYEYTDWDEVERFAAEFGEFIEAEQTVRSRMAPETTH